MLLGMDPLPPAKTATSRHQPCLAAKTELPNYHVLRAQVYIIQTRNLFVKSGLRTEVRDSRYIYIYVERERERERALESRLLWGLGF